MRDTPFVDAHVHFWDLGRIAYPWLTPPFSEDGLMGTVEPIAADYLPADYARDAEGWSVAGTVHVEAGASPDQAADETRWLGTLQATNGSPAGLVAFAPLQAEGLDALLEEHLQSPDVRGIRQIVNYHATPDRTYTPADLTVTDKWQAGFAALARHGLSFDLQAYPSQFAGLAKLFARHDTIPIMVNHAGMPFHDERELWRDGMQQLAALPQCAVKISGFGITDHGWTEDSIRPYVLETIDLFGPDRVMFASDFPTDRL